MEEFNFDETNSLDDSSNSNSWTNEIEQLANSGIAGKAVEDKTNGVDVPSGTLTFNHDIFIPPGLARGSETVSRNDTCEIDNIAKDDKQKADSNRMLDLIKRMSDLTVPGNMLIDLLKKGTFSEVPGDSKNKMTKVSEGPVEKKFDNITKVGEDPVEKKYDKMNRVAVNEKSQTKR